MPKLLQSFLLLAGLLLLTASSGSAGSAADLSGRWSATVRVKGVDIPFQRDLRQRGEEIRASFFDGVRLTNPSAPARIEAGHLRLTFPSYAAVLDLAVGASAQDGTYERDHASLPIHAARQAAAPPAPGRAPLIAGEWIAGERPALLQVRAQQDDSLKLSLARRLDEGGGGA